LKACHFKIEIGPALAWGWTRNQRTKGGDKMSNLRLHQLRKEAVALIKKGGLSAKIGHAFLNQHGT
jgi:hypothetical protein